MGVERTLTPKAGVTLRVNLNTKDAQAVIATLAKKFENIQKASELDLDIKNLKGVGDLLTQLQTLDQTMTKLLDNSKLAGSGLSENVAGAINDVIANFQQGNELSTVFLNELNEIANITDKSKIPARISELVYRMNQEFSKLGLAIKINTDDILNLGNTKDQLTGLANYITTFTSRWSEGMTFAAKQTDGLVQSTGNVDAEINKLLTSLNKLRTIKSDVESILNTLSSGGQFKALSDEEYLDDDFAEDIINKYNSAKQIFASSKSSLEMRQQAVIDMAHAAKDAIRALSYEDGDLDVAEFVNGELINDLGKIKKDILSHSEEIKSLLTTEIASIEEQLIKNGIDVNAKINVTPKVDPKAEKKIKKAVEESAPKDVEVPVKTNINTDNTKEIVSLVEQLQNAFDIGSKKNTLEYKILFTTDGLDIRNGDFQGVSSKTYAEALLGNLINGVNVNAHSHMGKYSEFTLPDIQSVIDAKKNLGINLSAVIGPDDIATLDLTQVKLEDLYILLEKLSKLPYADILGIQANDLNNALKEINPNYGDIFKKWQPDKFEELAKYIYNVSQATQSTINPLEQFKNIISFIASKDIDFSKYQNVLDDLSANNFSPDALKNAFNEIAKAEKIMSDGKVLKIDIPEKSTLDVVTQSLQEQINKYKEARKEAGITYDKLRQEVSMWGKNRRAADDTFFKKFFHPAELDDVINSLTSGDSVKTITERLASEFNIEIPVKTKVDKKQVEESYKQVLDILNQIAAKEKEIQILPDTPDNLQGTEWAIDKFYKIGDAPDQYKQQIKEIFDEYYSLQSELNRLKKDNKGNSGAWQSTEKQFNDLKSQIAGIVIAAEQAGVKLEDVFSGKQLKTINADSSGIQNLIAQWKEYEQKIEPIQQTNIAIGNSLDNLRDKILELAKSSNLSKDAYNSIVGMLWSVDDKTGPDRINQIVTTINGLISGKITPEITTLKQKLSSMFQDIDIDKLELKYLNLFDSVRDGTLTAAQALEQIEKQENEIAEAARKREEAQRKANDAGSQPTKPSGTGSGTGSTTPPSGTGTGASTGTEIADLEKLKQKVSEVELEVVKKTRAFNDEKAAVGKVVEAEMSELTKLSTKIKQVIGEVNNYSTAWTNADSNVTTVVEKEGKLIESLLQKLQNLSNILANEISKANLNINTGNTSPVDSGSTPLQGVSVSVDPKLSSTLEILNSTLSQMIGSGDDSSQKTSPNQGLSGIATNVANIYGILNNPASKDSGQEQNNSDNRLPNVLTDLNNTLSRFAGISDTSSKATDTSSSIGGIATNVANIYDTIKGRKDNDDALATSIKSAVNELHEASKYIADDAKLRQESNTKYQAASDRISNESGRDTLFQALERQYGNEYFLDKSNVEYTGDVGGIVKIKAVLQDVNDKFYNLSATIDSQGNIVTTSIKENEKATIKYVEQEKALAKAREDAAKKAQEAVENEIKAKQTEQSKVVNKSVDAIKQQYDNFFKDNNINNAAIKGVQTEYQELLDILAVKEEIYKEGKVLTDQEVADIEARCKKIQDEIDALLLKKKVVSEQRTLISDYDTKTSDVKKAVDAGDYSGSSYEDDIKNTLKEIDAEASKLQNKTKDGRMQLLSLEELEQTKIKLNELYVELDKIVEKSNKGIPKGAFTKQYDGQLNKVSNSLASFKKDTEGISLSVDVQDIVNKSEAAIQKLKEMRTVFENTAKGQLTTDQTTQWKNAIEEAKKYQKQLDDILKIHNKIKSDGHIDLNEIAPGTNANNNYQMYDAMEKYLRTLYGSDAIIKNFDKKHKVLKATFIDAKGRINEVEISYSKLNDTLSHSIAPIGQVESTWSKLTTSIGNKVREMAAYFATFGSVYEVINVIRQGINSVREIDSALAELKKVTDETDEAYAQFLQNMSKTAGVVGSTVKDLTTMAAEWSRLGYSMAESAKLAESTAILLNVSEFNDATEASEALISTMQAFQYTADESVHVVDILNEVGNNYAVSSDGIATALQDSASALMEGGNNLEQAVALVAAANKVVQDPNSVGSALRTISLRLRGTSVEVLEELGEETDNVVESTSKLQKKIKALSGVNILTESGEYKDTYTILAEIGEVWEKMSDIDQAALLELMAGKNRANTLSAILSNMKDLKGAYEDALNAEGSALKENETHLNSIQGRIDLFTNALQTMWMNFISSDIIKFFVDLGTAIVQFIDKIHPLTAIFGSLATVFVIKNRSDIISLFKELTVGISQTEQIAQATTALRNVMSSGNASVQAYANAINGLNAAEAAQVLESQGLTAAEIKETMAIHANTSSKKLNKAATVGLTVGLSAVALALTIGISLWNKYQQEQEEARQAAIAAGNAYKDNVESIESYKSKISELKESLDSGTLSEEEAYQARLDLIAIKDDVVSAFGEEAKSIDILRDSADQCNAALDGLTVSMAKTNLAENADQIQKAINKMTEVKDWFNGAGAIGWSDTNPEVTKAIEEIVSKYTDASIEYTTTNNTGGRWMTLNVTANAEDAKETLVGLSNDFDQLEKDMGIDLQDIFPSDNEWSSRFQYIIENTDKVLDKYKEIYDQQIVWNIVADADLNSFMSTINDVKEELRDAIASNDNDKLISAFNNLDAVKLNLQSIINDDSVDQGIKDYLSNLIVDIEDASKTYRAELNFEIDFNNTEHDIKKSIQSILEKLDTTNISEIKSIGVQYKSDIDMSDMYKEQNNIAASNNILNNMSEQEQAYGALCAIANEYEMEIDDLISVLGKLGLVHGSAVQKEFETSITTIDHLTSAVESYKTALNTIGSITSDGQAISEDYYNTLKEQLSDITVAEEGFSDAIDEQNGKYIVKNVNVLQKLVKQSQKAKQATINVAKAQTRTQYKNLTKQIQSEVKAMYNEYKAYGFVADATFDNINAMQAQLSALKETIRQYTLLELALSEATNGYREFENAKTRDSELAYGDSMLEMIQTINDGFASGKVGSEAFQAAVKALVPDSVYADLDNMEAKMKAIHDYLDKDSLFADYFTIDADGNFSIAFKNVKALVDDFQKLGIFTGDNAAGFSLSADIGGMDDIIEKLQTVEGSAGLTQEALVAMITELSKYDARWSNILEEIMATPLDREIIRATDEVDVATQALEDFWNTGEFNQEEYDKLLAALDAANKKLEVAQQNAQNNARDYNILQAAISSYRGALTLTDENAQGLISSLKQIAGLENLGEITIEDGQLKFTQDQINLILQSLGLIEKPTIMYIQTNYDTIVQQIQDINKFKTELENNGVAAPITVNGVTITNKEEAEKQLQELIPQKENIEVTYGITETSSEEQKSVLESYQELAKNGLEFTVTADVTDANKKIDEVNNNNPDDKKVVFTADATTASDVIKGIADQLSALPDGVSITIETKEKKTIFETVVQAITGGSKTSTTSGGRAGNINTRRGNSIFASGSTGLKHDEHNSVVGELGRELICDVDRGVYYTVGDNGTEVVDLPKNAIIYNHKQTEELLKKGHTSRGTPTGGLSFAKGNAHFDDGETSGLYGGYVTKDGTGATLKDTAEAWKDANDNWLDASNSIYDAADTINDASDSIDDAADEFKETINWIEVLFTRIDNILAEHEAYFETIVDSTGGIAAKESVYNTMYGQMYNKASYSLQAAEYYNNLAETILSGMDAVIAEKVRTGTILIEEITDEKLKESIDKALEYLDQKSQYVQQYYQTVSEIADKAKEHLDEVAQAYENEIGLTEHLNNMLEAHNDLLETREGFAAEAYYKAQISANKTMLSQYKAERKALQAVLDEEVRLGHVKIGDSQWFEMQQAIYDVDDAIIDMEASIEDLQNAINDLHWDRFDELINRFEYIEEEISNVIQLISHDPDGLIREELRDLTTDNWATGSGLATIGLYAQEMERAQYVANEYAEAIKQLERDRDKYNETEYLKKMNELISAQYENIEKYYDAKDAIIELNEARVDAIRDGIEKEIDAYQDLIDKKKELLDSERDLHDFQNEISEKEKEVSDIRKQLAAMAGDDTAATTAKRKQLEAELIEAQKSLEESYYSHSMNAKQEALDKEFSSFEEEKNAEIEKWEEWLGSTEQVVSEALTYVKENTTLVYNELTELGSQYGLTLSDTLTTPWQNGQTAIDSYSTTFEAAKSNFTSMLDEIALHWENVTTEAERAARAQANALHAEYNKTASQVPSTGNKGGNNNNTPKPSVPSTPPATPKQPVAPTPTIKVGGKINAGSAQIYDYAGDTSGERQYYRNDPIYTVLKEQNGWLQVRYHKLSSGITGWFKKNQVKAYARGTIGTTKDQWALIDELGDELLVNADGNGRLSYLTKGTGVVPADLTEKIMNLALDPASALDGVIPKTRIPSITANNFDVNLSFDSLVHADNVTQDTLPELQKVIRNEFNYMMKEVNNGLKRAGKSR